MSAVQGRSAQVSGSVMVALCSHVAEQDRADEHGDEDEQTQENDRHQVGSNQANNNRNKRRGSSQRTHSCDDPKSCSLTVAVGQLHVAVPRSQRDETCHDEAEPCIWPGDDAPPFNPSGLRLGTPAITTRGMKEEQMDLIAGWIDTISHNLDDEKVISKVGKEVEALCGQFQVPENFTQPQ